MDNSNMNNMNEQFNNQNNMYNQSQVNQNIQPQTIPNNMPNTVVQQQMQYPSMNPQPMPNQNMNNMSNTNNMISGMNQPRKSNNLIIIIAIAVVVLIVGIVFLTKGKASSTDTNKKEENTSIVDDDSEKIVEELEEKTSEALTENIETRGELAQDGNFIVFIKNKNSTAVDIDVEVEFYDAAGKIVATDTIYLFGIAADHELADYIYNTPEEFSTYKIYADAESTTIDTYFNDVSLTHNDNGKSIIVQAKNNSEDIIEDISISVVFYKDDKIVGIESDYEFDLKANRTANFTVSYPVDKDYNYLSFDTYKVYLVDAYTLDF